MNRAIFSLAVLLAFAGCSLSSPAQTVVNPQRSSRPERVDWKLVWSDEFNGPDGSSPDPTKWTYDLGAGVFGGVPGWGNNELESYTNRAVNVQQKGGYLVITAQQENYTGSDGVARQYTSARIKTQGLYDVEYGRIEARIKIPAGQGIWPAFWMLGNDINTNTWPSCGEIDVMENIGKEPSIVHGTIHGPVSTGGDYFGGSGIGAHYSLTGQNFSDDFHIYTIEWTPNRIQFLVDNNVYETRTPADLPSNGTWVFAHNFFILLNVAVGGGWPGNPDSTTVFPQQMLVDYVRVYQMK